LQKLTEAKGQVHSLQAQLVQKDAKVEEKVVLVNLPSYPLSIVFSLH
jgi:hypothetical protein